MQTNQRIRDALGVDLKTVTRVRSAEIFSVAIIEALGEASGFDLTVHVNRIPDITAYQIMKSIDFDLVREGATAVRLALKYDWRTFRIILERDGEHVAMAFIPGTMTYPGIEAIAKKLGSAVERVCQHITVDSMDVTYTYDNDTLDDRGLDWCRSRVHLTPIGSEQNARHSGFNAGRSVTIGQRDGVSASLSYAKGL